MIDADVRSPVAEPVRSVRHRVDGDGPTGLVLGAALVAMTLVAGLCYTFSAAVMPNLADADDRTFVATMQRFNDNPTFQITFTAALVLTALAAVLQRRNGPRVAARWTLAALVLYGVVLAVTFGLHIPLNNDIDRADPNHITDLAQVRDDVEGPWAVWNIPRTLLTTAAVAALAVALLLHGRGTADRKAPASAAGRLEVPPPVLPGPADHQPAPIPERSSTP
jgi:uncharacterized membrane protein